MVQPTSRSYGPADKNEYGNKYRNVNQAYDAYQKTRAADKTNPTLAPKDRFATIYGWAKKEEGETE